MCQSDFHSSKHWELLNWRATCSQVQAAGQGKFRDQQTAAASKNSNTAVYSAHYDSNMPNGSRSTTQTEQQQQLRRRWFENVCSERRDTTTTKNCNSASIHVVIKCWYWYVAICSFQFRSISIGSARGEGIFFFHSSIVSFLSIPSLPACVCVCVSSVFANAAQMKSNKLLAHAERQLCYQSKRLVIEIYYVIC